MFKVVSFFAGIGAPEKALKNIGIKFECEHAVEFDKYAMQSYNAIHDTNHKPVSVVDWNKDIKHADCDLFVHGSPCQSFSVAGKQEGGDFGSGTRSSLLYESIEFIRNNKPKYVVWENVPNVLSKRHVHNFQNYLDFLANEGYSNYHEVLNATQFGIPQNRKRVFCVSILGEHKPFAFPTGSPLTIRLRDMLDDIVEEKYYLTGKAVEYMNRERNGKPRWEYHKNNPDGEACTLTANMYKGVPYGVITPTLEQIANINGNNSQANRIYSDDCVRNLVAEAGGGGAKTGYYAVAQRGRYNEDGTTSQQIEMSNREFANTITTVQKDSMVGNDRIRKLTPNECFRLMGFTDDDFNKAKSAGVSNSQLYKQAGNSIVVPVLEAIFTNLLK